MKKRFWRVRQTPQELHYLDWAEKIKEKYFLNEEYGFAGATLTFLQGNRNNTQKNSGDERRLMLFFQNLIIYWENQVGVKITIGNERLWKQNVRIALEAALNHLTSEQEKIYFKETKLARELLEGRIKTEEQMRESRIFCRWQSGLSWEEISGIKTDVKYTDTPERIQELRHDTARQRKAELELCESRKISRQLQEEFWQNRLIYLEPKEAEKFPQDSNKDLRIERQTELKYKEKVTGDRKEAFPEHPQPQLVYLESKESETGSQEDKQQNWLEESREKQSRLERKTEEVNKEQSRLQRQTEEATKEQIALRRQTEEVTKEQITLQRQTEEATKEQIRLQKQTEEINREQIALQKQEAEVNKRQSEMERQTARDNTSDKTLSESRQELQKESQKEPQKESQKEFQKESQQVLQEKSEEESRKESQAEYQKGHQERQENFSQDSNNDFWIEHLTESEYTEKVIGEREEGLPEYDRPEHPQSQLVYLESKESETGSQEDKKPNWLEESREKQSRLERQTEEVNKEQSRLQRQTEEAIKEQIALQRQTEEVNKEQIEIQKQAAEANKRQSERERQFVRDNTSDKTLSESRQELQKEPQKESQKESQQELQKESQKESRQELQKESQEKSRKEYQTKYQKEHQENFSQDSDNDLWMEHPTESEYTEKITGDREEGLPEYDRPNKEWEEKETRLEYLKSRQNESLPGSKEEFSALMKKQSEIISEIETRVLEAETRIKRNPVPEKFAGKYSERFAEKLVEKYPERFAEQLVEKHPERFAGKLMEKHPERFAEQLVEKYPERFAEQLMEKHPERFAEKLAEKYPEKHTAVITNKLISEIHRRDILPVLQIRNGNIIYRYPAGRTGSPKIRFRNTDSESSEPRFRQAYSESPEPRFLQSHSGSPKIRFRNTHLGSREPHFLQSHSGSPAPRFSQAYSGSPEFRFLQAHSKLSGSNPLLSQPQLTEGGQLYRDAKIQYTMPESRKRNQETMRSNVSALSAQTIQAQEETRVLRKQTGYTQAALAEQEKRVDGLRKELHSQIKQVNEEVKRLIDQQKSDTSVRSLTDKVMKELQKQFRTEKIRRGY